MSELPLVTIITPSYNQGQFLEKTIVSVLNQDYPKIEYIVMDGGSNDESVAIIQRYANRIAYWESQPDRGQAHAINKGLQMAKGSVLGWLNSDDVLLPDAVRRVVQVFTDQPEVDVVYGRLERIDATGQVIPTPDLPKDQVTFAGQNALDKGLVNQPGSFWRREIMEKAGLLDESLRFVLDYEYYLRMLLAGAKFIHLNEPVAQFRIGRHSKTGGQTTAMSAEGLHVLERFLAQPGLPERLGVNQYQIQRQSRHTKATFCLYACLGCIRDHRFIQAAAWLGRAHWFDPRILFEQRWLDLARARFDRNRLYKNSRKTSNTIATK
jgi:glycosyltransferase involved in cell wall biosynthesis